MYKMGLMSAPVGAVMDDTYFSKVNEKTRQKRKAVRRTMLRWTNNVIPYIFLATHFGQCSGDCIFLISFVLSVDICFCMIMSKDGGACMIVSVLSSYGGAFVIVCVSCQEMVVWLLRDGGACLIVCVVSCQDMVVLVRFWEYCQDMVLHEWLLACPVKTWWCLYFLFCLVFS